MDNEENKELEGQNPEGMNQEGLNQDGLNMEGLDMTEHDKIIPVKIDEEMRKSYIDYSMSVIVSRALPDVRDGFKPVQRRVLFGMNELGVSSDKPTKKSARIVGDVMGKYHPHGDSSIYGTLVRLAQPWNMRYCLVFSSEGITDESSWITICAEMYGQIERKPIAHCPSAPPVNTSNQSKIPPPPLVVRMPSIVRCSVCQSTPGVGICETRRQTATRPKVMSIFLRSSGILNAFEKPFHIAISRFTPFLS